MADAGSADADARQRGRATPLQLFACSLGSVLVADVVFTPVQAAKVRMQLAGAGAAAAGPLRGFYDTLRSTARYGGVPALWSGLGPALVRQSLYGGLRVGCYRVAVEQHQADSAALSRLATGVVSGGLAAFIATPADVVMIRVQAEAGLPPAQRRYAGGTLAAFRAVARDLGPYGMFRGASPSVLRACIGNASSMATYDVTKRALVARGWGEDAMTFALSSFVAGVVSAAATLPVDAVKSRMVTMSATDRASMWEVARRTARNEGLGAFFRGAVPHYLNVGPWLLVMFFAFEGLQLAIIGEGDLKRTG